MLSNIICYHFEFNYSNFTWQCNNLCAIITSSHQFWCYFIGSAFHSLIVFVRNLIEYDWEHFLPVLMFSEVQISVHTMSFIVCKMYPAFSWIASQKFLTFVDIAAQLKAMWLKNFIVNFTITKNLNFFLRRTKWMER